MRNSMRRAVQRGDYEHATRLLEELQAYADENERLYGSDNVLKSFGAGDVRHNLAPGSGDRKAAYEKFVNWLTPADRAAFEDAQEFQQKTLDPWRNPALRAMLIRSSNTDERKLKTVRVLANRLANEVMDYHTDHGGHKNAAIAAVATRLDLPLDDVRTAVLIQSELRKMSKASPTRQASLQEQVMTRARRIGLTD
jgi:hypothetical protein